MKKIVAMLATGIILASPALSASAQEYEIEKGDTLWGIAREFETTVDSLLEINNLNSDLIYPKQKLAVYKKYLVEKGDTLFGISKQNDVTVEELKEWNDLTSDLILVGQELLIKEAKEYSKAVAAAQTTKQAEVKASTTSKKEDKPEGQTLTVVATAYTAECDGCSGVTYTGIDLNADRNAKVIAVDPSVIPLGSKVYVEGYGTAIAGDIGGAIKGNRIDIHVPTTEEALNWGVKEVEVTIIE
ncbi:3D domain-containing protein [Ornithinibacillus contaminans]|uniref:3D domain-containing protein n=1 Tax=Ornithinibacillus contaminans TaxID=694055 RepID=UPI00064DBED6|nr:3D domain-containing protein [Ornithinibacillus contaminans]